MPERAARVPLDLKEKKIVIGVTGGIAAYKIPFLIRALRQAGVEVRVVMTDAALEFVTAMTLTTLSGNEVIVGTFPDQKTHRVRSETWHIDLGLWADAMVIAPATANTIAKLAAGFADNAVTTLALALRCPLIVAPAMDMDMWEHETTQANVTKLREIGYFIVPPAEGELASGLVGPGRLPEFGVILEEINNVLARSHRDLEGKRILVTAGPTHEAIDPVRFIGNRSSGKMGFALARAAALRGAGVTLIAGPVKAETPRGIRRIDVQSAQQMLDSVLAEIDATDALIMAAAVADFTPESPSHRKIKKEQLNGNGHSIKLLPTADILQAVAPLRSGKVIVGFALETENGLRNAQQKLKQKKLDMIVLNNALREGAGFGGDTNIITLLSKQGSITKLKKMSKFDAANEILDRIVPILGRRTRSSKPVIA